MKLTFDVPDDIALGLKTVVEETIAELTKWPQKGDHYYYITSDGNILFGTYDDNSLDEDRRELGNMFKTIEEVKFKYEQLRVMHELEELADDKQPKDGIHVHYTLMHDVKRNQIFPTHYYEFTSSSVSFKSYESALAAIDKIGADRLIKYYFKIPEDKT